MILPVGRGKPIATLWCLVAIATLGNSVRLAAADFTVTSPGFFYAIDGESPNPTLTLVRGQTYTFQINAGPTHPFEIRGAGTNVVNNNIFNGTITFHVPLEEKNYTYICSLHFFGGNIETVPPPTPAPPPTIEIQRLLVGTDLVLTSTGTNNWRLIPEFKTSLGSPEWTPLTVQTNVFLNGINETVCEKPRGTQVFVRLRAEQP